MGIENLKSLGKGKAGESRRMSRGPTSMREERERAKRVKKTKSYHW
jgi:hypothetical protein